MLVPGFRFFFLSLIIFLMFTSLLWLNFIITGFLFSISIIPLSFCLIYEFSVEVDLWLSDLLKIKTSLETLTSCRSCTCSDSISALEGCTHCDGFLCCCCEWFLHEFSGQGEDVSCGHFYPVPHEEYSSRAGSGDYTHRTGNCT